MSMKDLEVPRPKFKESVVDVYKECNFVRKSPVKDGAQDNKRISSQGSQRSVHSAYNKWDQAEF